MWAATLKVTLAMGPPLYLSCLHTSSQHNGVILGQTPSPYNPVFSLICSADASAKHIQTRAAASVSPRVLAVNTLGTSRAGRSVSSSQASVHSDLHCNSQVMGIIWVHQLFHIIHFFFVKAFFLFLMTIFVSLSWEPSNPHAVLYHLVTELFYCLSLDFVKCVL